MPVSVNLTPGQPCSLLTHCTCTWTESHWTFPTSTSHVLNGLHQIITEQEHSFNPVGYSANTRSW